jgi:outer membrane protein assembly factor BamB
MVLLLPVAALTAPGPGTWVWRFVAGGASVGEGAFDAAGRYYFAAEDRFLYALDRDGVMRWRTDLGRRAAGIVACGADGTIYTGLEDGRLLALNKDGRLLWLAEMSAGRLVPPLLFSTGMAVIADTTGHVEAVTHAGRRIWSVELGEELSCAPIVAHDGILVFGTVRGNLHFLDQAGTSAGQRFVGDVPSTLASAEGSLFIGTTSGNLIKLDSEREPAWRADLGSAVARLVVGGNGNESGGGSSDTAYAILDDGSLVRVLSDGIAAWRFQPTSERMVSIVAAGDDDGVLAASRNGSLSGISARGELLWETRLPTPARTMTVDDDGRILISTERWVTYAYTGEPPPEGAWPMRRGTPAGTGVPPGVVTGRPDAARYREVRDYVYLSTLLNTPFEEYQLQAIREIARKVDDLGGSYFYVLSLCEEAAAASTAAPALGAGLPRTSDRVRREAIGLLGEIGDLTTARILLRLLRSERESSVLLEVLAALTQLGANPDGNGIRLAREVLDRNIALGPQDQVALAVIDYLEAIYRYEGGFPSAEGVELLTRVMSGPYGSAARERAVEVVRGLTNTR